MNWTELNWISQSDNSIRWCFSSVIVCTMETPVKMKVTSLKRTLSKFLRKTVVILYRIVSLKSQHHWHVNRCWNSIQLLVRYQFPLSTRSITGFCVSINSIGIKWLCNQLVKVVSCNYASVYCCPYYFSAFSCYITAQYYWHLRLIADWFKMLQNFLLH